MKYDTGTKHDPVYISKALLAGGLAGSIAKTVIGPFDRVKILFQVRSPLMTSYAGKSVQVGYCGCFSLVLGKISGVFRAIALIFRYDGCYGLYRGHSAMLLRIFPYSGINYMAYEQYKRVYWLQNLSAHQLKL